MTTNTGSMSQKSIDIQGGSFIANGTVTTTDGFKNAGRLSGGGTINGNLNNFGILAPGNSPGTLTVNGNFTQGSTGIMNIEIAGLTQGVLYDFLKITGSATLDGKLDVDLLGFRPTIGDEFTFLTASSVSGMYKLFDLPFGSNYWDIIYGTTFVTLEYLGGGEPVPEPSTMLLVGLGLAGLIGARRRFKK